MAVDIGQGVQVLSVLTIDGFQVLCLQRTVKQQFKVETLRTPFKVFLKGFSLDCWKDGVDGDVEKVLNHVWYESIEKRAANLDAGVSVALDEPYFEIFINQKVKAEELELVAGLANYQISHLEQLSGEGFDVIIHLRVKILVIVEPFKVFIEIVKGDLVGRLVFAILITVLLDGIVGEVDELIHVFSAVLLAAGPHVPFAVEPESVVGIECPYADVKLSAFVKQWVDVFLDNVCFILWESDQGLGDV